MSKALGDALRELRAAKGITIKAIAQECGIEAPAVSQWFAGRTEPTFANLRKAAKLLDGDVNKLLKLATGRALEGASLPEQPALPAIETNVRPAPDAPPFEAIRGFAMDIIVYGTMIGGDADSDENDFRLNGNEIDRAPRPPGLLNTKGVFALRLENHSMYPAWKHGALVYINPNRSPNIDDDVVIEMHPTEDGVPGKAFLKRLVARTPSQYVVKQFNPLQELSFDRKTVKQMLRVVPVEEWLGFS